MKRRLLVVAIAIAVSSAACSDTPKDAGFRPPQVSEAGSAADKEGLSSRMFEAEFSVKLSGAASAVWKGRTPVGVMTFVGGDLPRQSWMLTVGLREPIEVDGVKIRPAFDLIGYEGERDYTIAPPRAGGVSEADLQKDPNAASQAVQSNTFVVVQPQSGQIANFNVIETPCRLSVRRRGLAGEIECPKLSNGKDTVQLQWSWDVDEKKLLSDDSIVAPPSGPTSTTAVTRPPTADDVEPGRAPKDPATGAPVRGSARLDGAAVDVAISPPCVEPGRTVQVKITGELKNASVTMAAAYADGQNRGTYAMGRTDAAGSFSTALAVPPDAPKGIARLVVGVSSAEQDRSASGHVEWRVGGC